MMVHDGFTLFCLMIYAQTVSLIQFSVASHAVLNQERLVLKFPIELGARPLPSVGIPNCYGLSYGSWGFKTL